MAVEWAWLARNVAAQGVDERWARRWLVALWAFVAAQLVVLVIAVVADDPVDAAATYIVGLAGACVFTVSVLRRRPEPLVGWILMVAAVWMVVVAAAFAATSTLRSNYALNGVFPTFLAALSYPVMAMGLAVLSRSAPRARRVDVLDGAMAALAAFLLLWAFAIEARIDSEPLTVLGTAAFAIGILLVFSLAVRLVLVGGMREPVLRLLILGVFAILASAVSVLLPLLSTAFPKGGDIGRVFWGLFAIAVGAAGLHPALAHLRFRANPSPEASRGRIGLFAVLALVPPAVWGVELSRRKAAPTEALLFVVPVGASAVFLLLLVTRLGLVARLAHQRASELSTAVSEQQQLQGRLAHLAMHDSLTGLPNRRALSERMDWAINKRRGPASTALLLLDLDGFKDVNDTLGHPVGDELLVAVSRRLLDAAPPGATLARLGGDEFAVLVEDDESDDAAKFGERLSGAFRRSYLVSGQEMFLTASVGVLPAGAFHAAPSPAEALRDADLALYAAKAAGKNQVVVFRPELRTARTDHTRVRAEIRDAWANDEFQLMYQPIMSLDDKRIVAVEALIRWDEGRRLDRPADFIPIAQDIGLSVPIGAWVVQQACHDARDWYQRHQVAVAVNVSARQLGDAGFVDALLSALSRTGLPGRALILEIAERDLVTTADADLLRHHLRRLQTAGVRVAIDEFGAGLSSLSNMVNLSVDIVKIDKAFTHARDSTGVLSHDWAFTRSILRMVDSLDMLAIANGVETAEQAKALKALHCPLAQGGHLCQPLPAASIDRALAGGLPTRPTPPWSPGSPAPHDPRPA